MDSKSNAKCTKKTNLLVYPKPEGHRAEKKGPCSDLSKPRFKIPICNAKPKQIRVCTGAEMKKMCPPKLCHCDKKTPKVKKGGRGGLLSLLGFGIKAALAAAAWYVTYDMGIWGSSDDTQELYKTCCQIASEPQEPKKDKWEPLQCTAERQFLKISKLDPYAHCSEPVINIQRQAYNLQNKWNHAIACVFSSIAGFPFNVIDAVVNKQKKVLQQEEELEPECIPYSELPEEEREELIRNAYKKK